jgi:GNAT superfamily N-acetyltransferase
LGSKKESLNMSYLVEPLSATKHRRNEFACEDDELTGFFCHRSWPEMESRASACFVLVPESDPGLVAGFYTLSAATVSLAKLPSQLTADLPKYPNLPATLLGRLARHEKLRGAGLGDLLLVSALRRSLASASSVGSVAMVTDPKNAKAEEFYQNYGFRPLGNGRRLFLPMKDITAWLEKGGVA